MATKTSTPGSSSRKKSRTSQSSAGSRLPLLLSGLAVVVLAVIIAAYTASGREDAVSVADIAGNPVIDGEPLPAFGGDPAADPAVGARGPVITGADFDGTTTTIGETGEPQLLMFLASWCPACQEELPQVVTWLEEGNLPEGVELKAVATGLDSGRPNWPPDAWFDREGYEGPLLVDDADGAIGQSYGLSGTPYWVALDAEGQVVGRISGMIDMAHLSRLAESLAQG